MSVTRFPNGVATNNQNQPLGFFGMPDPTKWVTYFNDFLNTTDMDITNNWTSTETEAGAGDAAIALQDETGGVVKVTNDAADDDAVFLQLKTEMFKLVSGKKAFFKTRCKVSEATQADFVIGLQIKDTTPLDATDGVYFMKDDGDTQLDVYCRKDATTGSTSATNIHTVVADTYMELAWYYDGVSEIKVYVDGVHIRTLDASSTYLPDTEITVSFGIQNGDANARNMSVDYIFVALER